MNSLNSRADSGSAAASLLLGASIDELILKARAQKIAGDLRCGEGPAWIGRTRTWIFSDIPNNRMLSYSRDAGLSTFQAPSDFANGNYATPDGGYLTCRHLTRCVTRTGADGDTKVVCDSFGSRRLNSPNDVTMDSRGNIWFSDPTYGIVSDLEGRKAVPEQVCNSVYRVDAVTAAVTAEIDKLAMPNGLCLSPDERTLYVADSGAAMGPDIELNPEGPRFVVAYKLDDDLRVYGSDRVLFRVDHGVPDGIRCDSLGRIWTATGRGIECHQPDGTLLGAIATPDTATNLCFGGAASDEMLITTETSAYLITF